MQNNKNTRWITFDFWHVNYPNVVSWFNTTGSYDHETAALSFTPSISIGVKEASGSIGLAIVGVSEMRSVDLEIDYNPNVYKYSKTLFHKCNVIYEKCFNSFAEILIVL